MLTTSRTGDVLPPVLSHLDWLSDEGRTLPPSSLGTLVRSSTNDQAPGPLNPGFLPKSCLQVSICVLYKLAYIIYFFNEKDPVFSRGIA